MTSALVVVLIVLAGSSMLAALPGQAESVPLELSSAQSHDLTLSYPEPGVAEIVTTGDDPYLFTAEIGPGLDPKRHHVLAFEYFSSTGTDSMQVFVGPPITELHSVPAPGLSRSEGFSKFSVDLAPAFEGMTAAPSLLRIDFGRGAGKRIRIRGLVLRGLTAQEAKLAGRREAVRAADRRLEVGLRRYLGERFFATVTRVKVEADKVRIDGTTGRDREPLFLAEAPLHAVATDVGAYTVVGAVKPDAKGVFHSSAPRWVESGGGSADRLLSRWALLKKVRGKYRLASHARYADDVAAKGTLPEEKPRTRKGVGALGQGRPLSDLADLDISAVTVNIMVSSLLWTTDGPGREPFKYGGRTWFADMGYVRSLDFAMTEAAKRHIVVSAILLVHQASSTADPAMGALLAHPDADPAGIYVMPNLTSAEGVQAYAAALEYLVQRYCRPDGAHGRIHHWILHNEVNAGWIWTNAGEKTELTYLDLYHRSMRAIYLIARQYDSHSKAFISLEHHWTLKPERNRYAGKDLLEDLVRHSRAEGDFDWAMAFHPYPQDLFNPRVWEDTEVDFTFQTPKVTFNNVEVLDAWVRMPVNFYKGKPRVIHLSEQGLNSPDYSEKSLAEQAAGMAYAWNKMKPLSTIEMFHYHNWQDNRGEGGLRIGLRRFPDDKDDPGGRKPIWYLFQALGTAREAEATEASKALIGLADWSEVRHTGAIK